MSIWKHTLAALVLAASFGTAAIAQEVPAPGYPAQEDVAVEIEADAPDAAITETISTEATAPVDAPATAAPVENHAH